MSWRRRIWSIAALAWSAAVAPAAHADAIEALELRVTPDADGCVTEAALRKRLASLNVQLEDAYGLTFVVDAASEPAMFEVRRDDVVIATRRFDALPDRCTDRLQTVALVITLAIEHAVEPERDDPADVPDEPEAAKEAPEPERPPSPSVESAEPAADPSVESDDGQVEPQGPTLRTVVSAGAAYGVLPAIAGLLAVGVELPSTALRIGIGALVTSETSTGLAGGTALTRLAGARAYGCMVGQGWGVELHGCAGMVLGVVLGEGRDYATSEQATATLLAPLVRLGARYPAQGVLSAGLALEGLANLVRPELQVSGNAGSASSVAPFGLSLSLELVLALP